MGQGLYRAVGFGCLNPPPFDWDKDSQPYLFDALSVSYEAEPDYVMIPFGVDEECLQAWWNLPPLPPGLPNIESRTAVIVPRCQWWPDVGKKGVWVSSRIERLWELVRAVGRTKGWELPEGEVVFACDWD